MRNNPNSASSAAIPSRLGANGMSAAERGDPQPVPLRNGETEPINGRPNSTVDSSDSDRRTIERTSNQKQLSIITSQDDGVDRSQRPKPPLLRSKSDYIVQRDNPESVGGQIHEWGARHGFEDHYQSEDIISQLANVSGLDFLP